jgi:hypothetical protein
MITINYRTSAKGAVAALKMIPKRIIIGLDCCDVGGGITTGLTELADQVYTGSVLLL